MDIDRAILEIKNMILHFEDMIGIGCITKIWVAQEDIDALHLAVEALEEMKKRG